MVIAAVEELPGLTDEEAIAKSHEPFEARKAQLYGGFDVWKLDRMVVQYSPIREAEVIPFPQKHVKRE